MNDYDVNIAASLLCTTPRHAVICDQNILKGSPDDYKLISKRNSIPAGNLMYGKLLLNNSAFFLFISNVHFVTEV